MTRRVRGIRAVAAMGGACLVLAGVLAAPTPAPATPVPGTTCDVFPADNVWHLDVSKLPVQPKSDVWKRAMHAHRTSLHPDFGPPSYGIPFDIVDTSHADVSVQFTYAGESDAGPYPFGPDTHVEGGSDRHAIMIDRDACTLYELYAARWNGGDPRAGRGAIFDLGIQRAASGGLDERRRRRAADLSRACCSYDEVPAGAVDHAIRVTADCTFDAYVWPARHAGRHDRPALPADGRALPAEGRIRREHLQPCSARRDPCDEALRTDRRRQRQRLVFPGDGRPRLDLRVRRPAQADPREGVRGGRRARLPGRRRAAARSPAAPGARPPDDAGRRVVPSSGRARGSSRRSAAPRA